MSQVLGSQFNAIDPGVDLAANPIKAGPQRVWNGRGGGQDQSDAGPKDPGPGTSAEQSGSESEIGETVAVGFGNALDHCMQTQASQVIAHAALGKFFDRQTEQLGEVRTQLTVGETGREQFEHQHGPPQGLHSRIG